MRIKIITKPYEVTDQAGIKSEKLYMAKVTVNEPNSKYNTILAYHVNTKNYFLLNEHANTADLGNSFSFTEDCDTEIVGDFLEINNHDVVVGKSSTNWLHVKPQ